MSAASWPWGHECLCDNPGTDVLILDGHCHRLSVICAFSLSLMTTLAPPRKTPWPVPPLLRASLGIHGAAVAMTVCSPDLWPWAVGAVALNHAALVAGGVLPRSGWLGPNITCLPEDAAARGEWALTVEDGPDPVVTPTMLDLLDAYRVKATFFCIAARAQAYPELLRCIVARGHSVQNHSHNHRRNFAVLGPRQVETEVRQAQSTLSALAGQRPTYFRAPVGMRNAFLDPVLHRLGLALVSWTRRGCDNREQQPDVVLERLVQDFRPGDILSLHDGHVARGHWGRPVVLDVLPGLLSTARDAGLHAVTLPQALVGRGVA